MGSIDFFDEFEDDLAAKQNRDQYGRPYIKPLANKTPASKRRKNWPAGLEPYRRSSTLGDALSNVHGLQQWQMYQLAMGLGMRPDLAALAGSVPRQEDGSVADDREAKAQLTEAIEKALEVSGATAKATRGTAIHSMLQLDNPLPGYEGQVTGVKEFVRELGFVPIGRPEVFCANDMLKVAGSFDRMYRHPDYGSVVFDWKTGEHLKPVEFSVQLAAYATSGGAYDLKTHERTPFPEDINIEVGMIVHVRPEAVTVYEVDLELGFRLAQIANLLIYAHSAPGKGRLLREVAKK